MIEELAEFGDGIGIGHALNIGQKITTQSIRFSGSMRGWFTPEDGKGLPPKLAIRHRHDKEKN